MSVDAVATSSWLRDVIRFFAATLLAVICLEPRPVSAAECGPNCNLPVQKNLYGDPRCAPQEIVPSDFSTPFPAFEREGTHCDLRVRRKQAYQHPPSVTPQTPSLRAPTLGNAPVAGANGADRQQSRGVERDVGFDDAFGTTQTNSAAGVGVGVHGVAADPFRRAPASRR